MAGHDINYIALAGVLHAFGRKDEAPVPPLNLVGDFGGGGMLLGFGVACALLEAARSGRGQVVDAAMVEGASLLAAMFAGFLKAGSWSEKRGENILDSGAPWYNVYETRDGKYVSIGSIETRFFEELIQRQKLAGVLGAIRREGERPLFPLNLVGDFGGGGMLLALGVVSAVLEARTSGHGQVVDAAMVDGSAVLSTMFHAMRSAGLWNDTPGTNLLDTGAHFYEAYETKDGKHVSIGSIEPQFYDLLLEKTGLKGESLPAQMDRKAWEQFKSRLEHIFREKTRDEWCAIMEGTDICFAPILTMAEAPDHPHMAARKVFVERHGVTQPAPAPRFSRTPSAIREPEVAKIGDVTSAWKAGR